MDTGTYKRFNQGDVVQRVGWHHMYKGTVVARFRSWEDGEMYCIIKNFTGGFRWSCKEEDLEAVRGATHLPDNKKNSRTGF